MSSLLHALMPRAVPLIQLDNVTTGLHTAIGHNDRTVTSTIATMRPFYEYTTIDDVLNMTSEFYNNTTSLYGNSSDDSSGKHFDTHTTANQTIDDDRDLQHDHAFQRTDVRVVFISMYTLVFCFCFFGEYAERWTAHDKKDLQMGLYEELKAIYKKEGYLESMRYLRGG